jgi:GT2 family glycosyltransferase
MKDPLPSLDTGVGWAVGPVTGGQELPRTDRLDISCVVLTWNSQAYIARLLRSVDRDMRQSGYRYECVVIDNGSRDATLETLRELRESGLPIQIVPLSRNMGTTFPRNIGFMAARGRFVAVLDSDLELDEPMTFKRLVEHLDSNPQAAMISPRLRFPSGKHQKTADVFPTLVHKFRRYFFLRRMEEREGRAMSADGLREVDYACSAFWLFRRDLMEKIGGLDVKIFYSPEDVDYCVRCWLSGSSVLYDLTVSAVHHAQEISRKSLLSPSLRWHLRGMLYYCRKYRCWVSLGALRKRIAQAR